MHGFPRLLGLPPWASIWARNSSHPVGQDERGAILLRIKLKSL